MSLKAEGWSANFSNVTTRGGISLQLYAFPQCLMSGALIQYYCQWDASRLEYLMATKIKAEVLMMTKFHKEIHFCIKTIYSMVREHICRSEGSLRTRLADLSYPLLCSAIL